MQKRQIIKSTTIALVVALFMVTTVPVFAIEGSSSTDNKTESTEMIEKKKAMIAEKKAKIEAEKEAKKKARAEAEAARKAKIEEARESASEDDRAKLKAEGALLLAEFKKSKKTEKSAETRKKVCETRKQGLEAKFSSIGTNSDRAQARIDEALKKAQAYKVSKNIELSNYDTLLSAATTAQATSAASIASMDAVQPTVDCNSQSVASDIATFKAAAQNTRDSLKAYRTSVKALLTALASVKTPTATTTGEN